MSGITARPTTGKLQKANAAEKDLRDPRFITGQKVGSNRHALDTIPFGVFFVQEDVLVENGSDDNLVILTGHTAREGDFLRIQTSAGGIREHEVGIDEIVDANSFRLSAVLSAPLQAGDEVSILRPVMQRMSASGATLATVESAPVAFNRNGVKVEVTEDTVTPGNNLPLPVKLVSTAGEVVINAGDLQVQLSHLGVNADSTRIGDGTNELGITASNEAMVSDADALLQLIDINTELDGMTVLLTAIRDRLPATLGQKTAANSLAVVLASDSTLPLPTGAATEAKQDNQITELQEIEADVEAMSLKLPATLGPKTSATSLSITLASDQTLPLPSGAATEAKQDDIIANLDVLNLVDFATEAKQDSIITEITAVKTGIGSTADAAVTNPASAASVIAALKGLLTLVTSTNTKLDTLDTTLTPELSNHQTQAATANTLFTAPAGARRMVIQNSLSDNGGGAARIVPAGSTPTANDGFYLSPGQSTPEIPAGSFRAISADGVAFDVTVLWFV